MQESDSSSGIIKPQYKVIMTYDILPSSQENYYRFVMSEFVPAMQEMGVYMSEAWHTAYGKYPLRMVTFVAEEMETIDEMLHSEEWQALEDRFLGDVRNYSVQIVPFRQGFQFVR